MNSHKRVIPLRTVSWLAASEMRTWPSLHCPNVPPGATATCKEKQTNTHSAVALAQQAARIPGSWSKLQSRGAHEQWTARVCTDPFFTKQAQREFHRVDLVGWLPVAMQPSKSVSLWLCHS